ncbi:hypothetical protein A1D22_09105 [Pasteurellaceae bacterium LFhippo2]|nr:hypothetical protein [Pasteurellaceae bacterium LFhippo2]
MSSTALLAFSIANKAHAYTVGEELTGDTKLACEALLCLATGTRPSECNSAIKRYFSIRMKKPHDTFKARLNFLKLCPSDSDNGMTKEQLAQIGIDLDDQKEGMDSLSNSIASLPYDCTAETLNQQIQETCLILGDHGKCDEYGYRINPEMPKACKDLANHRWTVIKLPTYVGDREWFRYKGSLAPVWVSPKEE